MKRKIAVAAVLLCIMAAFVLPSVKAADDVYFSVTNNKILPLSQSTMPVIQDGQLYLPYTFFSSGELGIFVAPGENKVLLYSSISKRLTFDALRGTIIDQDDNQYYLYSPIMHNGIVYVPAEMVCKFFGLTPPSVIDAEPAPIVRIKSATLIINDATFPSLFKNELQTAYDIFTGKTTPSPSPSSPGAVPSYGNVTIYLSFTDLSGGTLGEVLDTFDNTPYKSCIFVAEDEVADNADLLRRAAAAGHSIGIWLKNGTYEEYQKASALLFEAAKIKTVLVTATGSAAAPAKAVAAAEHLIFWNTTKRYDAAVKFSLSGITGKLSTGSIPRESLSFDCSDKTSGILSAFLSYLSEYKYNVRRVNETTVPIITAK